MLTIQLKDFIKTGYWGTITIGSFKGDIIKALGKKYEIYEGDETQIIKYGLYEFFYWTDTGKVFGIQNDHLQANCTNHHELINYGNRYWKVDKWFLKENENITFKQIMDLLKGEDIAFSIEPAYKGCEENIIKCINSKVTFDFVNEYNLVSIDEKGKFKDCIEYKEENEENYVLNGIRLFDLNSR